MTNTSTWTRIASRVLAVIAAAIWGLVLLSSTAHASVAPPFEVVFPQEAEVTEFISSWGFPRSGGRAHKGNDLMAPKMTEVYAIAAGQVELGNSSLSGRYVRIHHADGWSSVYIHLNNDHPGADDGAADWSYTVAPGVENGTEVQAGQLIGWVGDSGNAEFTAPHTHFELQKNGRPVDPYPVLAGAHQHALEQAAAERQEATEQAEEMAAAKAAAKSTVERQDKRWHGPLPLDAANAYGASFTLDQEHAELGPVQ